MQNTALSMNLNKTLVSNPVRHVHRDQAKPHFITADIVIHSAINRCVLAADVSLKVGSVILQTVYHVIQNLHGIVSNSSLK